MSVATPFKSLTVFPYDLATGRVYLDVVDNLTLAQVMAFYWNLETFSLTFSGTLSRSGESYNFGNNLYAFSPSSTFFNEGKFYRGSLFPDESTSFVSLGSLSSAAVAPRARVAAETNYWGLNFRKVDTGDDLSGDAEVFFSIGHDLVNTGKYVVNYVFEITLSRWFDTLARSLRVYFLSPGVTVGGTVANTGTVTIGGIAFPWQCEYEGSPTTISGGSMSATSTSFTYP